MIVATAGHVDHGKTAMIKALTGKDTDRLPEEKARSLSIDLGFAYQVLSDSTTLGFVDVPGHEKFVRNMLAGVAGIDLGLLVIAADDGVMPQTREHFDILNLLAIEQYVVAITKIDRADDHRILEVQSQIESMFAKSGYREIPMHLVCAPDNEGVEALKCDLEKRARNVIERSLDGNFRMAIDRVFSLKGVGLIVTGMVFSGTVNVDDKLTLSGDGSEIRVRGIRTHDQISDRAKAGERCAINIVGRGISENSVNRGHWLLHSSLYAPTQRIDVKLRVLESEPRSLKHWTPTHLHIGADHLTARVAILSGGTIAAGDQGLAQLVLSRDTFVIQGDRFVLRDQSAQRTIAGGHVIDPFSPKRGRARPSRVNTLQVMDHRDPSKALYALTEISQTGVLLEPFVVSRNIQAPQVTALVESLSFKQVGQHSEERVFDIRQWQALLNRIEQSVSSFHQSKPESPGASIKDIQSSLKPHLETSVLNEAIADLVEDKRLGRRASRFHLPTHVIEVSAHDQKIWLQAAPVLAPQSGSPLSLHQAATELGIDTKVLETSLKNAVKIGEMVLVAKNRYLPMSYIAHLGFAAERSAENAAEGIFTVVEYCKQTGIGRNFGIVLLEYFDRIGFTERIGNNRRIKNPATSYFAINEEEVRTLVGRPDFKSGEGRTTSLVGSTPTLFRHTLKTRQD